MVEIKKYEAKTKEEALKNALNELNVMEQDLFLKSEVIEGKLFTFKIYSISNK